MLVPLLKFELVAHLKRPATWLYLGVLFLAGVAATSSDVIVSASGLGLIKRNSPFALTQSYLTLATFAQIVTSALVGTAVLRDFDLRVHEFVFTTQVTRNGYLGAKFFAAFVALVMVFAAMPLGALVGSAAPWSDRATLLPIHVWPYAQPFLVFVLPTAFIVSALFFAGAALTRNAFVVYTMGFALLLGNAVGTIVVRAMSGNLANLADPFGVRSFQLTTRYWTVAEKNALTIPLSGHVITNRALWVAIALACLAAAFRYVRLEKEPNTRRGGRRAKHPRHSPAAVASTMPVVLLRFDARAAVSTWWSVTRFHATKLLRSIPFLAIAAIALGDSLFSSAFADLVYGTHIWPLSWKMAEAAVSGSRMFMIVLSALYAGELVWHERQTDIAQMLDATPARTTAVMLGKITALTMLLAALELSMTLGGLVTQVVKDAPHIDPVLYAVQAFVVDFPTYLPFVAVSFLIHTIAPRKAIGHVALIVVYAITLVPANIGLEHRLLQLGSGVHYKYSDLNGFGPYPAEWVAVHAYWTAIGVVLVGLAHLFWVRGVEVRHRLRTARERFRGSTVRAFAAATFSVISLGAFVFYNTNILNRYESHAGELKRRAAYERRYKRFANMRQPKVVGVRMSVDLYPSALRASAAGTLTIVNKQVTPIDTVFIEGPGAAHRVVVWDTLQVERPAMPVISDTINGVYIVRLDTPLAPGDTMRLRYRLSYITRGFPNGEPDHALSRNGSFLNRDMFPHLAYNGWREIESDNDRRAHGLPPKVRAADVNDTTMWQQQALGPGADLIQFEAVVSTSADQVAIAPGFLKREWREGDRRYFEYATDGPIDDFFAVLSARWTITRDTWNGVAIEIYHHATHTFNVARMVEACKASLEYYTKYFGPYQHRQIRIVEFPRYSYFAQSFPNTIPYSEGYGFLARVDSTSPTDLDYPSFIVAHEIAHQWFPDQRLTANVQGAQFLGEGLAEYASVAVLDRMYGAARTERVMQFELNQYLTGRGSEAKKEMPLMRVEGQGYIAYGKGAVALWTMRDLIGADALDGALRAYLDEGRFAGPPFATTLDLMRHLQLATPDSMRYALHDLFETITLWDFRTDSVAVVANPDGTWNVRVAVAATKVRSDSSGVETAIPIADYVDVGVFGASTLRDRLGKRLAIRKVHITKPADVVEFTVAERPLRAGIDPLHHFIDRNPGNNVKQVARPLRSP